MIPLRLELQNFMSYRGEVDVDLSQVRLACLSGENGAGKSALLDAITWALWGQCRTKNDRNVVTLNETDVGVTFEFALGADQYRVFRRRAGAQQRLTLEFQQRTGTTDDWDPISGDNVRDTQRRINETLKMEYELFTNSAYLMQGQADNFTQKQPTERKKILADILDLDVYERLNSIVRDEARSLKHRQENLSQQLIDIEERLKGRQAIQEELDTVAAQLDAQRQSRDEIRQELTQMELRISNLEAIERASNAAKSRRKDSATRLGSLQAKVKGDREKAKQIATLLAREAEISAAHQALQDARRELAQWQQTRAKREPLERERTDVQHKVEIEQRDLANEIKTVTSEIARLDQNTKAVEANRKQLAALLKEARDPKELASQRVAVATQRRADAERIAELRLLNKQLRKQMEEIQGYLDEIKRGDGTCPLCLRPLNDGAHEHVVTTWHNDGKRLGDDYRANRSEIEERKQRDEQAEQQERDLEQAILLQQRNDEKIRLLRESISEGEQQESQRKEKAEHLAELQKAQVSGARWQAHVARIAEIDQELANLPYDAKRVAELEATARKSDAVEHNLRELEQARFQGEIVQRSICEAEAEIERLEAEIVAIDEEINDYNKQLEGVAEVRQQHAATSNRLTQITQEISKLDQQHGGLESQIKTLDALQEEQTSLKAQIREIAQDREIYQDLDRAFGRNGIQAIIIENVLPELADMTNELLRRMSNGHLGVRFETNRSATSREGVIETLDIIIRDEAGERPYQLYSGGEAFRINFAIRVALSKLLARRAGATIDLLVIDEGFGTQDSRGRDGLIEAIHSVEPDFATILTVTHIDEIRDQFPQRIDVAKTAMGSRVTVN